MAAAGDEPWVRWTSRDGVAHAFVLAPQEVSLAIDPAHLDIDSLTAVGAEARAVDGQVMVSTQPEVPGRISFRLR